MGIKNLTKLLGDHAPGSKKTPKFESYFGRKIAVDASMHIYQFMMVVGRVGDQLLVNEAGEETSHLQGMFYRTARMLEAGLRPVYVFDGKPPEMKKAELEKRLEKRDDAEKGLAEAKEAGDAEKVEKYSKRTVRVTRQHNEECKQLLMLMGVPVIDAPSEAEAQCAVMCKEGLVYGVATEDMDALTFGTPTLIRNLMAPQSQNKDIMEFKLETILEELGLSQDEFVDLCILCGCDYCPRVGGVGPTTAFKEIKQHRTMEKVLEHLRTKKNHSVPEEFPFDEARKMFNHPEVLSKDQIPELKWKKADADGLVKFLVEEKNFSEDRVRKVADKINASRGKANQGRLESFFGPVTVTKKRKEPPAKGKASAKAPRKGKLGGFGKNKGK
ncbi:hypothetical protein BSKO_01315 [Bryopsis sp. KO-2023]|nr:hypothetical protein BSKO_01315 [Bryopsis sp. KO-2023]